jgi:hypothetical protein
VNALVGDKGSGASRLGEVLIGHRFRGPPRSGNGGYTCGRLAEYIDGQATVRLMKPPPLDIHLDVMQTADGVELRHGEQVIARAWPSKPDLDIPDPPDIESARAGRKSFVGDIRHMFPGCFVCGTEREDGDGLLIHAGPDGGGAHHVACNWTPHASLCGQSGELPQHLVWAALDCPGGWSFLSFDREVALLGEFSVEILAPLRCGDEYVVAGWEISRDGRKRRTGSALYSAEGAVLARALATWITIDPPEQ